MYTDFCLIILYYIQFANTSVGPEWHLRPHIPPHVSFWLFSYAFFALTFWSCYSESLCICMYVRLRTYIYYIHVHYCIHILRTWIVYIHTHVYAYLNIYIYTYVYRFTVQFSVGRMLQSIHINFDLVLLGVNMR